MTPEQLRASILQYAMEGKLVKQDPNDEPASELLKKIEDEKNELVKEGKIKKNKKLFAITDEEKQFDIPSNWEWVKLGNIVDYVQRGKSPKYDKESNRYPIISQKCVQWDGVHLEFAKHLKEDFWEGLPSYRFVTKGDLLLNSTGTGTVGRIIKVTKSFDKIPVDSHVTIIRLNKNVCNSYILYFLMSPIIQNNLDDHLTGTTKQKEFGLASIQNIVISIPPLEEQKRIVAKIEKLMPLVDEYAESYNRLQKIDNEFEDKLKQSVLQYAMEGKLVKQDPSDEPASELIKKIENEKAKLVKEGKIKKSKKLPAITNNEKPFDIPNSWEWVRLGNITIYQNGYAYKSSELTKIKRGLPVIKSQNIMTLNVVIKDNNDYVEQPDDKMLKSQINKGDLLMCLSSQSQNPEPLGKTAIYTLDEPALLNQRVLKLKLIDTSTTNLVYYFINSPWFHYTVSHKGSGSGQSNLKLNHVRNMLLPIPPIEEQKRIVAKIQKLQDSISSLS